MDIFIDSKKVDEHVTDNDFSSSDSAEDPVAKATRWGPAKSGGTSMGTHALRVISPERVEFKARLLALVFPGVFALLGVAVTVLAVVHGIQQHKTLDLVAGSMVGLLFFLVGFFLMRHWTKPRVFDKSRGIFWKGRKDPVPDAPKDSEKERECCELNEIYAVQLIKELCTKSGGSSGRPTTYYSYELNLVLEDGSRINVVDHGNGELIRSDGIELSKFLGVPLWDRI